jgi:hypothetical protein
VGVRIFPKRLISSLKTKLFFKPDSSETKYKDEKQAIYQAYLSGSYKLKEIGEHYGKHYSTISRMVKSIEMRPGKTWPYIFCAEGINVNKNSPESFYIREIQIGIWAVVCRCNFQMGVLFLGSENSFIINQRPSDFTN